MRTKLPKGIFTGVHVTISLPGNKQKKRVVHRPAPGTGFVTEKGVEMVLAQTAEKIEKTWPNEEYGMVQTGPTAFNFVWRGPKTFAEAVLEKLEA